MSDERIDKLAEVVCAGIHSHNTAGEIRERLQHDRTRYRRAAQAALDCYYADDDD